MTTSDDSTIRLPPIPRFRAAVAALVFLAIVAFGPLAYWLGPAVRTRAAEPMPRWSLDAFLRGEWTKALQAHLRETSLVTVVLRGLALDVQFLFGNLEPQVTIGRGGALFATAPLNARLRMLERNAAPRRAFLARLRAWSDAHDVHVLCVPIPDKSRVWADRAYPDGLLPEARAPIYDAWLGELRDAGLEVLDVAAAMRAWQVERPEESLYFERDTHWSPIGAWRTARLAADRLAELGWLDGIPRAPVVGMPPQRADVSRDLAEMLGLSPFGPFASRTVEVVELPGTVLRAAGGPLEQPPVDAPDAGVALCGDSFTGHFLWAFPAATGRVVDSTGAIPAGGPVRGLAASAARIADGSLRARVIVWVTIERSVLTDHWAEPPELR